MHKFYNFFNNTKKHIKCVIKLVICVQVVNQRITRRAIYNVIQLGKVLRGLDVS